MRRRSLLASAGTSIAALAGCSEPGDETDPPTEQQPIDETSTLSTTTEAPEVTVESVIQQYGYATANDDAIHVARTGTQYVVAAVTVEGATWSERTLPGLWMIRATAPRRWILPTGRVGARTSGTRGAESADC